MVWQFLDNMSPFSLFRFFADGGQDGMYIHVEYDPAAIGYESGLFLLNISMN